MKCQIFRDNSGRLTGVQAPNGKSSILYNSILESLPEAIDLDNYTKTALKEGLIKDNSKEEIALAIWSKVYTPSFKSNIFESDENGEPLIEPNKLYDKGEFHLLQGEMEFYNMSSEKLSVMDPSLGIKINKFLSDIGVDVTTVDNIKNRFGKPINAYGKAKLSDMVIQLVDNERGRNSLPEEAAHMITALMGKNHPIIKQMMNQVTDYKVYADVKREYDGVYETEEDYRFEAVGKLIAKHIIAYDELSKQQRDNVENWWTRLLNLLRGKFRTVDTTIPKETIDNFQLIARSIVRDKNNTVINKESLKKEGDKIRRLKQLSSKYNMNTSGFMPATASKEDLQKEIKREGLSKISIVRANNGSLYMKKDGKKFNPFTEFYNLAKSPTQQETVKKFLDTKNRLIGTVKNEEGKDVYKLKDKILSRRVSNAQDELFAKGKSKEQLDKIRNAPTSVLAREAGTQLHEFLEDGLNYIISANSEIANLTIGDKSKNTNLPKTPEILGVRGGALTSEMSKSLVYLAKNISQQQTKIDPNGKAVVFTENFVVDDSIDTGGTQDVLVVYSDGSASIYDYKFINFKRSIGPNGKSIIPTDSTIPWIKERSYDLQLSEYKRILKEVYGLTKIRETRILPFSIRYEYDKKKNLTGKVRSLEGFNESKTYLLPLPVAKELSENPEINSLLSQLYEKQESLAAQLGSARSDNDRYERIITEMSQLKGSIQKIQVLNDFKPLLDSIDAILNNIESNVSSISIDTIDELNKMDADVKLFTTLYNSIISVTDNQKLEDELQNVSNRMALATRDINNKRTELLLSLNPDIQTTQKEIEATRAHFSYTSQINHPVFETANSLLKTVTGNVNRASLKLNEKIKDKTDSLKTWAKGQGMSLWDAFDMIMTEKGTLINELSSEFYEKRKKAINEEDITWLKDNYRITEEGKKKYESDLQEQVSFLKSRFKEGPTYNKFLSDWVHKNNLEISDYAWSNHWTLWKYAELKNKEGYYSPEYKKLTESGNKPLLDYYNFYIETNKELNTLVGEKIDANFIANVKKSWVEAYSETGDILTGSKKGMADFKKSFETQQDGMLSSNNNEVDIPLMYYGSAMVKKDGKWVTDKSKDLSKSLQLFGHAVHKKHELSKIRGIIDALQEHINHEEVMITDGLGRVKTDKYTDEILLGKSTKNAELFSAHMKALVFGERLQNKDIQFMEKYSMNNTLSNVMTMFSANTLALSYVSAFGNVGAGVANVFIKGVGGRYYKNKHVRNAILLKASRSEKDLYNHMTKYFNVESRNWNHKLANELSATTISKNATVDKAFTLWQKGDDFVSDVLLMAMTQNYGISKDGFITRIDELPEGSKTIKDMFKIVNDKPVSGLTDTQYDDFRRKVAYISRQVKGSNTTEELSRAQMSIMGKTYMFFKNWLPPMASERFGSLKWTEDLQEFEYGRFRSVMKEMTKGYFLKKLPKLLLNLKSINKMDASSFKAQYIKFLKLNPQMKGKITEAEYIDLRKRSIREGLYELRMVTSLMLMMVALGMDWDDDGKKDYTKYATTRELYKLLKRTHLELSFFSNPVSVTEIIQNPVPIIKIGTDLVNFTQNTSDEIFDRILGLEGQEVDKTPIGHNLKKMSGFKHIFNFWEDWNKSND